VGLEHFSVSTADGRRLDVTEPAIGEAVPWWSPRTPGANVLAPSWVEDAQRRNPPHHFCPGRVRWLQPSAEKVRSAGDRGRRHRLDFLGIDRFASWDCREADARARLCGPDAAALVAVASISCPAPYPAVGLDWTKGMGSRT